MLAALKLLGRTVRHPGQHTSACTQPGALPCWQGGAGQLLTSESIIVKLPDQKVCSAQQLLSKPRNHKAGL